MDTGCRPRHLAALGASGFGCRQAASRPLLKSATPLLFRVQMMKKKGRKCPHPQRPPCRRLCPRLQTRSLSGRTTTPKVDLLSCRHMCLRPARF